ncbi:MAG: YggS family pyridoxal phosphate-dependent enzyme [Myxococcales bacterium]|nr:YggS family pyridoxal phosphate-dependent enzyme [Myxococcales bacterium]
MGAAVAEAARAAGRDPASVGVIAVSKLQPASAIEQAVQAGQRDFGENYAQELRDKTQAIRGATWHFIGPLQRNKVKYVVGVAALIHTVDGPSLCEEIARRAAAAGVVQRCLIQVNVAREPQKSGCDPDALSSLVDAFAAAPSLRLEGLMCIPPAGDAESARGHFRALATLAATESARSGLLLPVLSMGMSGDFKVAIAEGATLVRIGTAIFGERPATR